MCGRYATGDLTWYDFSDALNLSDMAPASNLEPRYNIAPTVKAPIAVSMNGGRELISAAWGVWQPWMEGKRFSTFNAREDRLDESRLFNPLLKDRRCLVPARGFYEWTGPKKDRRPNFIRETDGSVMVFAGLWDEAMRDGETYRSFTIITTNPTTQFESVHNRMPVILDRNARDIWMDGAGARDVLVPYAKDLEIYPIAKMKREDGPHQIVPL